MADPFIGEIRPWALTFAPMGWAFCNGQLISIQQNTALFAILGTTYGGDGKTTFGLPNLQGRAPMHYGAGPGLTPRHLGETAGGPNVALNLSQLSMHNHNLMAQNVSADSAAPAGQYLANSTEQGPRGRVAFNSYGPLSTLAQMAPSAVQTVGTGAAHENRQPFLTINICIALQGIFPVRS